MTRYCKTCDKPVPDDRSRSHFCSLTCKFFNHIHSSINSFPGFCALCGQSTTIDSTNFFCTKCRNQLHKLDINASICMKYDEEYAKTVTERMTPAEFQKSIHNALHSKQIKKNAHSARLPNDRKISKINALTINEEELLKDAPIKSHFSHKKTKHDDEYTREMKSIIQEERVKQRTTQINYVSSPDELVSIQIEKEYAQVQADLDPNLTELQREKLQHKAEHYGEEMPRSNKLDVQACVGCSAYNWGLSKFFDNGGLRDISMKDLLTWKSHYDEYGYWDYTFNCEKAPLRRAPHNCEDCEHGHTKWIPRYDDYRGHYLESPIEFIESFQRFIKGLNTP